MIESGILDAIEAALRPTGIRARGVVRFDKGDGPLLGDGRPARSVVLLGNVGGSVWPAFSRWRARSDAPNPLDTWSRAMIEPVAGSLGATSYFPSDPPYQPFQRWAMRAEGLAISPLGILIHPRFGLWHGYRGALGFDTLVGNRAETLHPGTPCCNGACRSSCPVDAVTSAGFDVARCRAYLSSEAGEATCMIHGCAARNACPTGAEFRYPVEQLRFHMQALSCPASSIGG